VNYTDPHIYLYDEANFHHIYVMDDFGTAVKVPFIFWYNPPIWSM